MNKVLLFLCLLFSASLEAGRFLALVVGDTSDPDIALSVTTDLEVIKEKIEQIAVALEKPLSLTILKDDDARVEKLLNYLHKLEIKEDDLFFFYQSSHGYRTKKQKSQWPLLAYNLSQQSVSFEELNDFLLKKKPQLLLSIADVCNSLPPDHLSLTAEGAKGPKKQKKPSSSLKKIYQKLFSYKGAVIISSSKAGQKSFSVNYITSEKKVIARGLFSLVFTEVLEGVEAGKIPPSWTEVFQQASESTARLSKKMGTVQNPQVLFLK